ncbi:MAG: hypothetical protein RQ745_07640 [Longimicrobiales bacterium]|nr:hypothetical protein [Longimicrobiales bacterium]
MRAPSPFFVLGATLLALALFSTPADAQFSRSIGAGLAVPTGDLADTHDRGFTVRAQYGTLGLGLIDVHMQGGYSRFEADPGASPTPDEFDTGHIGPGVRVNSGTIFFGGNALFFFGDGDEEVAFVPEVGINLLLVEIVADYRFTGDAEWVGIRAGVKF